MTESCAEPRYPLYKSVFFCYTILYRTIAITEEEDFLLSERLFFR